MLANLWRNAEWSQVAAFASPAAFDVLPMRKLYRKARSLIVKQDSERFQSAVAARRASLRGAGLAIALGSDDARPGQDGLGTGAKGRAARIATLYFHQLAHGGPTLLDLRATAFTAHGEHLSWTPSPWVVSFEPAFMRSLRSVYEGFYGGPASSLRTGLDGLGIASCEDLFLEHFGKTPRAQVFRTKEFVDTFHQVFVRCRDQGIELDEDFLPLGIYLGCLYDSLEQDQVSVDVEAAYERSQPAVESRAHA